MRGIVLSALVCVLVSAELTLDYPPPKNPASSLIRSGPCGTADVNSFGASFVEVDGGSTLEVFWSENAVASEETAFRIALAPVGSSAANFSSIVLLDHIPHDPESQDPLSTSLNYKWEVVIPDVSCEECILQVAMVLGDHEFCAGNVPEDFPSSSVACADIRINSTSGTSFDSYTYSPPSVTGWAASGETYGDATATGFVNMTSGLGNSTTFPWVLTLNTSDAGYSHTEGPEQELNGNGGDCPFCPDCPTTFPTVGESDISVDGEDDNALLVVLLYGGGALCLFAIPAVYFVLNAEPIYDEDPYFNIREEEKERKRMEEIVETKAANERASKAKAYFQGQLASKEIPGTGGDDTKDKILNWINLHLSSHGYSSQMTDFGMDLASCDKIVILLNQVTKGKSDTEPLFEIDRGRRAALVVARMIELDLKPEWLDASDIQKGREEIMLPWMAMVYSKYPPSEVPTTSGNSTNGSAGSRTSKKRKSNGSKGRKVSVKGSKKKDRESETSLLDGATPGIIGGSKKPSDGDSSEGSRDTKRDSKISTVSKSSKSSKNSKNSRGSGGRPRRKSGGRKSGGAKKSRKSSGSGARGSRSGSRASGGLIQTNTAQVQNTSQEMEGESQSPTQQGHTMPSIGGRPSTTTKSARVRPSSAASARSTLTNKSTVSGVSRNPNVDAAIAARVIRVPAMSPVFLMRELAKHNVLAVESQFKTPLVFTKIHMRSGRE